ncbi:TPA: hypothetical protein DCZ39_03565 [Patescibacteria group bacterium]|nr:hypothetical protein [Candidatus Gracilibacteria bacterium]
MNTSTKKTIDMTKFGEIYDEDGDANHLGNLGNVLHIITSSKKNTASDIFKVFISKVGYNGETPYRYTKEKNVNIKKLKEFRKIYTKEEFCEKAYQKYLEENDFERASYEKEAQRRGARGLYSQCMYREKSQNDERNFQEKINSLPTEEREKAIKKRNESSN